MQSQLTGLVELPEAGQVLGEVASGILAPEAEGGCPWHWLGQLIHFLQTLPGGSRLLCKAAMTSCRRQEVTAKATLPHSSAAQQLQAAGSAWYGSMHSTDCCQARDGDQQQCKGCSKPQPVTAMAVMLFQASGEAPLGTLVHDGMSICQGFVWQQYSAAAASKPLSAGLQQQRSHL